ncbi:unnamed protein product [Cochlearia groenlandica]
MEEITVARAAVKFGSAVSIFIVSATACGACEDAATGEPRENCTPEFFDCRGGGACVRSNVTVGNGAEAEIVAMLVEQGRTGLASKFVWFIIPSWLDIEPDSNIVAAAVVVEAMATAAGGNGWLWFPS